ncbi:hypothetical protein Dda3937_02883 [Dickeya dadantii 3937]|uniref:Uncharacterized protein n=1 Tax=Dickeya dadantii (strain 3937) TaxID=198628 RepID=E0SL37_DICD3|nr:hypothetical protein Dda3937_02883 [Dickeya dadantii 3937]
MFRLKIAFLPASPGREISFCVTIPPAVFISKRHILKTIEYLNSTKSEVSLILSRYYSRQHLVIYINIQTIPFDSFTG